MRPWELLVLAVKYPLHGSGRYVISVARGSAAGSRLSHAEQPSEERNVHAHVTWHVPTEVECKSAATNPPQNGTS